LVTSLTTFKLDLAILLSPILKNPTMGNRTLLHLTQPGLI
jgi:hypothetical protein